MVTSASRQARVQELVEQVAPVLQATAATSEASRRLAPEAMNALIDAGILRALLPAAYRGEELGAVHGIQLFEELACFDSAASWVGMISAAGAWLTILVPPQAAEEMLSDPRAVINGSLFPPMSAEAVQGGYRVSGRTSFASGSNYATWFGTQALLMENGTPVIGPTGIPVALVIHFPAADAQVIDNWNTLGMRGTGSNDVSVSDIFVPQHRVWPISPYAPVNPAFTDSLSRMGIWWLSPVVASVALGIARAAVADLVELAQTKVPSYTQTGLADKPVVQERLARARATIDAARAYMYGALATAENILQTEPRLTIEQGMPLALSGLVRDRGGMPGRGPRP